MGLIKFCYVNVNVNYLLSDSDYLQEINVGVASKPGKYFDDYEKCGEHDNRGVPLPSNERIVIVCSKILRGRSVIIWKKEGALVRPDAIAIAEINLYSEPGDWNTDYYKSSGSRPRANHPQSKNVLRN